MSLLSIHKVLNGESWVNVYHLQAAYSDATATTQAEALVAFERSIHQTSVLFTHYNLSDNVEETDAYFSVPLNQMGQVAGAGSIAPLYMTLRIDFSKLGGGRPGRKYYRGVLDESIVAGLGAIDSAAITNFQTKAQAVIDTTTAGGENFTYVNAAVYPLAQMRQLRRGSKKKKDPSPVIPV